MTRLIKMWVWLRMEPWRLLFIPLIAMKIANSFMVAWRWVGSGFIALCRWAYKWVLHPLQSLKSSKIIYRVIFSYINSTDARWYFNVKYCGDNIHAARIAYHEMAGQEMNNGQGKGQCKVIFEYFSDLGLGNTDLGVMREAEIN